MIKEYIRQNLLDFYVEKYSKNGRVCKDTYSLNAEINDILDNLFTFGIIPKVERLSSISASEIYELYDRIGYALKSLSACANNLKEDYENKIKSYMVSSSKIINNFNIINNRASKLLEYNCIAIPTAKNNQDDYSDCSNIGKFVVLPYFKSVASMYNGDISVRYYNTDEMIFTNIEEITSLPIDKIMSFKVSGKEDTISLIVNLSIAKTNCNMVYFKITNPVNNVNVKLNNGSSIVGSYTYNSNEILINFEPTDIDNIELNIVINNLNKEKPSSIQIENVQIFSNMVFRKLGRFESKPFKLESLSETDSLSMYHANYGDKDNTYNSQYIALSSNMDSLSFNKIDTESIDLTLYKYNHTYDIINPSSISVDGKVFSTLSYDKDDLKWDSDIKRAKILYGLNDKYLSTDEISNEERFSAWSQIENYYYTNILNYEDDVYVNIGSNICTINNKEVTGNVLIPKGISKIGVHIKDIDINLKDMNGNIGSILNGTDVMEDRLYPYNLLYMFSGLPEYINGEPSPLKEAGPYSKLDNMSISLGDSFIPFTEIVKDDAERIYSLQLSKSTSVKGTYTIEPHRGIIKVVPFDSAKSITIKYRKTNINRKACGILFNRLLTFAPLEVALMDDNSELFTVDGNPLSKSILMPIANLPNSRSQFLFNTVNELMYASTRIELQSLNKYLTPIVSDIYIQTR